MDQGTILLEFQKEIEEIKIAALESEKAIEEENSRRELNSNFQDQIFLHEEQERIFDMSRSSDMEDIPKEELIEDFVCAEIEACLKGDDVQMTNIFNRDTNIHDDVRNVSDIGLLEKNGIHKMHKDKGDTLKSAIWNPELLLWIFRKQFQKICRTGTKSGIVERLAFISIGGSSKMNSSTSRHNKDLNVKLKEVKQKCLVRDNSPR
ncbi:hypothetical protein PIB30_090049, partial [Stylosanthes scabra]|nr:hypothetical protein [Stylosanthes scabra]